MRGNVSFKQWDCVIIKKAFTKESGLNLEAKKDCSALSAKRLSLLPLCFVMTWYHIIPNGAEMDPGNCK